MRRLASIAAVAIALTVAPVSLASANAAPSHPATVIRRPRRGVYIVDVPEQWICIYEGNQLVESGKYQAATCRAGTTGYRGVGRDVLVTVDPLGYAVSATAYRVNAGFVGI